MNAPSSCDRPIFSGSSTAGSSWPVMATAELAMRSPSIRAPASPMKSFAGVQFMGRKPRHAPTRTAAMKDARLKYVLAPVSRTSR